INLLGKVVITGKIRAETGLSIGGATVGLDIGGLDNPVIKDAEGKPYIPGSSLKGKMRSLLEKANGLATDDKRIYVVENEISIHMCNEPDCMVCNIFGRTTRDKPYSSPGGNAIKIDKKSVTPTRLIVRDAVLTSDSEERLKELKTDLEFTEVKWENVIDRITSAANPRQMERVPEGAEFEFGMIYNVFNESDKSNLKEVFKAMELVEHDYLGGSGSRGYGKVKFENMGVYWNSKADYENGTVDIEEKEPINGEYKTPASIVTNFEAIREKIR
ncbi:MAG: type III-A CRISPR-associated RAMP protein Csm3, partial [Methanophagales archaeon]|nr:type III-A CRISPR-associated RAMP protein Csm3 [Methanophagales archaeon]